MVGGMWEVICSHYVQFIKIIGSKVRFCTICEVQYEGGGEFSKYEWILA